MFPIGHLLTIIISLTLQMRRAGAGAGAGVGWGVELGATWSRPAADNVILSQHISINIINILILPT